MVKVVLVGYMGSGKSIISKKVSEKLKIQHLELDEIIENDVKLITKTIFETKGELFFRKMEHKLFVEAMNRKDSFVLSTGGGTPCYFDNHLLLQEENCISIYLKASIDTLYKRLIHEKYNRPLLANIEDSQVKEFIAKHLFDRNYYYNQAKYVINVDDKSIDEIVSDIESILT